MFDMDFLNGPSKASKELQLALTKAAAAQAAKGIKRGDREEFDGEDTG